MEMIIYRQKYDLGGALDTFYDFYFSSKMKYFASDLLKEGLSPSEITKAVRRAITACKAADVEIRQHFAPVYAQANGVLVEDCKLSQLGYMMVLLNANVKLPIVAQWQLELIASFCSSDLP